MLKGLTGDSEQRGYKTCACLQCSQHAVRNGKWLVYDSVDYICTLFRHCLSPYLIMGFGVRISQNTATFCDSWRRRSRREVESSVQQIRHPAIFEPPRGLRRDTTTSHGAGSWTKVGYIQVSLGMKSQMLISQRFNDGEVVRYGAGESWRPTPRGGPERDRSPPRRARSPGRDRDRSRPRSPRPRSPVVSGSDSYVPGRYAPRRRSQSRGPPVRADTYRRERSRDRESPRRRDRTRSPPRRSPPSRSLSRRGTPRRISPGRGDRYERPRSPPRRDWDRERDRDLDRERARERDVDRDRDWRERDRDLDRRDDRRDDR